jgi:2-haloacid dehalogenase
MRDIDTLVFDILGTLVDHTAGLRAALAERVPAGDVDDLVALWSATVGAAHRRIVDGEREYATGAVLDREAAHAVTDRAGLDAGAVDALVRAAEHRPAWPDTTAALAGLADRYELIGLSNADRTSLLRMNASAGLRWHTALSTQDVRSYKPDPAVYRLAIDCAGRPPERMLMVAAHAWDLRGARAAGLRTAYVHRPGGDPPSPADRFDRHLDALEDLAAGAAPVRS